MELINISKKFGNVTVLDNINFKIEEEKITVILGESGCGKTTLLKIISGIMDADDGRVVFEGEKTPKMGYIFQEDALIPWKTVYENIDLVLKNCDMKVEERKEKINLFLSNMKISDYMNEYPSKLSGGMRRRVGIIRGFIYPSKYLLMDEPFEFLDIKTKQSIINDFKQLQKKMKKTVLCISHDIDTTIEIADKIVILSDKPTFVKVEIENTKNIERDKLKRKIESFFLSN